MAEQINSKIPKFRFKGFEGEWSSTTLQTACSLLTGYPFQSKQFTKSGFLLVRGMNVKRGYVDDSERISEFWPSSSGLEVFLLKKDDIVIQMDGALIGRSYAKIRQENLPALLVQRVTRARCESTSNSDHIYQYIERDFLKYIRATKTETAVPHLSLDDIRQFPISISTPTEQTQIGEYFRELDRLIGLHQRKHDKLLTLKKAMLQKMFPQPGATTPEIRFKGFSRAWVGKKLGDVGQTQSGIGFPDAEQGGKTGTPFFKVSDMSRVGNEQEMLTSNNYVSDAQLKRKKWTPISNVPAVIFAKVGAAIMLNRKRMVRRPFLIDNNAMAYLFDATWDTGFGRTLFDTINLPFYAQVGALPSYNGSDIESIVVRRPDNREEQQKIGTYFRTLDSLISKHATQLQKLKQIKSACLEKMFV